jgi:PAS domain S-box-containing protein
MDKGKKAPALKKPVARSGTQNGSYTVSREFLDLLPDFVIACRHDGVVELANRKACEVLRRNEGELVGVPLADLCPPEHALRLSSRIDDCLTTGKQALFQTQFLSPDRTVIDVELNLCEYALTSDPAFRHVMVMGRDISEEKKKDLDFLRFSNIAHYTVNPLEITDVNGCIVYVNPAFEKASGYSKEELLGQKPSIFGSGKHPKSFWDKMWKTITSGKVWVGEIENRRRDGSPFFTFLLVSPIIDAGETIVGYFGVHRDVTDQKNLEKQLIHAQKMESIGMLAAGLAHEVGNPLTSISSLVQVIQRTTDDEFTQEKLELIKSQITRISKIIRDLVDFSRRSAFEVQLTDVNKNLHDAVEIVRVGKKAKQVAFQESFNRGMPMLRLVPDQIEQVFINILINAVDAINERAAAATAAGKEQAAKTISVATDIEDEDIVITIEDTGRGIPEEHLPQIFEPFFTTKKVGEGTGLGLWVSYGIIKSFQGNIKADSTEGKGTVFTITLPLHSDLS